jgi:hypothetical protein
MAQQLGFELIYVDDLPHSARSVTDLENGRIYLPPASIPGGHGLRSMALQAMAHRLLGHTPPTDYADFLEQRLEINYYAACCLCRRPRRSPSSQAKKDRDLAVEDFRDAFGVTHEAAAMRMTNLLTEHLGIRLHFLRVDGAGAINRVYENDDLPLPMDVTGSVEARSCAGASPRAAFGEQNRTVEHYQYTDTRRDVLVLEPDRQDRRRRVLDHRGRALRRRSLVPRSRDPEAGDVDLPRRSVLPRPDAELTGRWDGKAWPSARVHMQMFSPLPRGPSRRRRRRGLRLPRPARGGVGTRTGPVGRRRRVYRRCVPRFP